MSFAPQTPLVRGHANHTLLLSHSWALPHVFPLELRTRRSLVSRPYGMGGKNSTGTSRCAAFLDIARRTDRLRVRILFTSHAKDIIEADTVLFRQCELLHVPLAWSVDA